MYVDCDFLFLLQFSQKTTGIYKATISDDRGKDMSQIDISGKGMNAFLYYFLFLFYFIYLFYI